MVCTRVELRKQSTGTTDCPPESPLLLVLTSELQAGTDLNTGWPGIGPKLLREQCQFTSSPVAAKADGACAEVYEEQNT